MVNPNSRLLTSVVELKQELYGTISDMVSSVQTWFDQGQFQQTAQQIKYEILPALGEALGINSSIDPTRSRAGSVTLEDRSSSNLICFTDGEKLSYHSVPVSKHSKISLFLNFRLLEWFDYRKTEGFMNYSRNYVRFTKPNYRWGFLSGSWPFDKSSLYQEITIHQKKDIISDLERFYKNEKLSTSINSIFPNSISMLKILGYSFNELYDGNWIVVPNLSRSYGHNGVIGLHLYWQVWNTQRIISLVSLESGDPVIVEEKSFLPAWRFSIDFNIE